VKERLRLPNAALRYKPTPPGKDASKEGAREAEPKPKSGSNRSPRQGRIYLVVDPTPGKEKADPKIVEVGITDGINTELKTAELPAQTKS